MVPCNPSSSGVEFSAMATKVEPLKKRDDRGRYLPGSGGRTEGSRNKATISLANIRQRILNSWLTLDGDKLLADIAGDRPLEYLKLLCSLLPKPTEGDGPRPLIIVVRSDAGMGFAETLQQQSQRLPALEAPHVVDALRAVKPDLNFNGVSNGNDDDSPQLPTDDPRSV